MDLPKLVLTKFFNIPQIKKTPKNWELKTIS